MNAAERAAIRAAINSAKRAALGPLCGYCGQPVPPSPVGRVKRHCSDHHRKLAWLQTAKGRVWLVEKKRRERAVTYGE